MNYLIDARSARPSDDPIFTLNADANARKARGEPILNATIGVLLEDDGTLAILPTMIEALRAVPPRQAASYAPLSGTPLFIQAVLQELFGTSPMASQATAVATAGGTGALRHAFTCFLEPHQAALTTSLYWSPYQIIAEENDRRIETFSMFNERGELDINALEAALERHLATQKRALLIINDPCHNPTGYSLSDQEWAEIISLLERSAHKGAITLVVDIAYYLYAVKNPRNFGELLAPLVGKIGLAFAWSASKSFAQYGARIGSLVVVEPDVTRRQQVQAALTFACRGTWSNCNHGAMAAIARILSEPELHAQVNHQRAQLCHVLDDRVQKFNSAAQACNLRYPRYDGGFFTTVFTTPYAAPQIAEKMRNQGVFVVPQENTIRLALCAISARDVERLVLSIRDALM